MSELSQYNIQFSTMLISSLLTLTVGIFLKRKNEERYSPKGLCFNIFKCLVLCMGFTLFFITSTLLLKINASSGLSDQIPDWLDPFWYITGIYSFFNIITLVCYVFAIQSSNDFLYDKEIIQSDIIQVIAIKYRRYEIRYGLVSLFFGALTIFTFVAVFISIILLCDPGNC